MVADLKEQKRRDGRFFGRRVNCEYVPFLPASVVALFLGDPRKTPYLLVWKDDKWARGSACPRTYDGEVKEAVRLSRYHDPQDASAADNYVQLKRTDGDYSVLRIIWRMLPRNGARALFLFCPYCQHLCRSVYGWQVDHWGRYSNSARVCPWRCRTCAGLRYASEGGALILRSRWSFFRMIEQQYGCRSPRPERWYPYVFTSINDFRLDEVLGYQPAGRRSVGYARGGA